jgi:hypothetical protein
VTTAPVPGERSFVTSFVGGGPVCSGTFGAPVGNGPFTATHGLPFADATAAVVGVDDVDALDVEVVVSDFELERKPDPINAARMATTIAAAEMLTAMRRRALR